MVNDKESSGQQDSFPDNDYEESEIRSKAESRHQNKKVITMAKASTDKEEYVPLGKKKSSGNNGKLNAEMLEKLEKMEMSIPTFYSPTQSIIGELKNVIGENKDQNEIFKMSKSIDDADISYIEQYMTPEFLSMKISRESSYLTDRNSNIIFEDIVNDVLLENSIHHKWFYYVQLYVHMIVNIVKPNPNRQNEVINYNDYVKV